MDIQYLLFLQSLRNAMGGCLNSFFAFITNIAVDYYIVIPALIIFWVVDKKKGAQIFMTWGAALGINAFLKTTFCVYRPWIRSSEVHPVPEVMAGATGYSFPSGHSSSASGFYGGVVAAYRKYKGICVFCIVMVLLTMFSRNYVGVHTPQDVVVGACTGVLCAVIVNKVFQWLDKNPEKDWVILLVVIVICTMLLPYIFFKHYPMDYVDGKLLVDPAKMTIDGFKDPGRFFGIYLGWFLERRYVNFEIRGTNQQKILICLIGAILFVLYWTVIGDYIGKMVGFGPVHFILQASAPVVFMTVYPQIFSKFMK